MYETVIVGAGPGGTGPLVCAAQQGRLIDWLESGVAIVDQSMHIGGTLGRYTVNSDSMGRSYLECFDHPPFADLFGELRREETTQRLYEYFDRLPPLPLVGAFLQRQGFHLERLIARYPASRFVPGSRGKRIRLLADGRVAVGLGSSHPAGDLVGASAILALGGRQVTDSWLCRALDLRQLVRADRLHGSDELLAGDGMQQQLQRVGPVRSVVILGSSHSAFSVAWWLLEHLGDEVAPGTINILHRTEPRIFYPSREAADADFYPFSEDDICPATQRVNRLSGLRGDGRELWRRIHAKPGTVPEHRVVCRPLDDTNLTDPELLDRLREADLVATTFGYVSGSLPIYNAAGAELRLEADADGGSVDHDGRLRLQGGAVLPNLFGIGLGTGYRPFGRMGGEPSCRVQQNSLWLYQNDVGDTVGRAARRAAAALRQPAVARGVALTQRLGETAPVEIAPDLPIATVAA
jgi:hypothetical protein